MPSANERALEKAKTIPADAIIFDLEDAVAPDAKEAARDAAVAAVQSGEYGGKTLTIRCNGLDTPWGAEDLSMWEAYAAVLPPHSPALSLATRRVASLTAEYGLATVLQPRRN